MLQCPRRTGFICSSAREKMSLISKAVMSLEQKRRTTTKIINIEKTTPKKQIFHLPQDIIANIGSHYMSNISEDTSVTELNNLNLINKSGSVLLDPLNRKYDKVKNCSELVYGTDGKACLLKSVKRSCFKDCGLLKMLSPSFSASHIEYISRKKKRQASTS